MQKNNVYQYYILIILKSYLNIQYCAIFSVVIEIFN